VAICYLDDRSPSEHHHADRALCRRRAALERAGEVAFSPAAALGRIAWQQGEEDRCLHLSRRARMNAEGWDDVSAVVPPAKDSIDRQLKTSASALGRAGDRPAKEARGAKKYALRSSAVPIALHPRAAGSLLRSGCCQGGGACHGHGELASRRSRSPQYDDAPCSIPHGGSRHGAPVRDGGDGGRGTKMAAKRGRRTLRTGVWKVRFQLPPKSLKTKYFSMTFFGFR
jgi:hypothetical protein